MRRTPLGLVLLLGCTSAAPDTTVVRAITEPGLVAAWGFDEASGTTAADATCNGHTATLSGQTHVVGKSGNALGYSGNFATVADAADLHLSTAMTLEAWVYPTSLPNGQFATVLMKERPGELTYDLYASSNVNRPELDYTSGSPAVEHNLAQSGGSKLSLNTWTHLAGTFDGTTMRLYRNGAQVASKSSPGTIYPSTSPLRFGGNSVWNEYFTGRIDEVRIYNRVLAASEILANKDQAIGSAACGGAGGAGGTGGSTAGTGGGMAGGNTGAAGASAGGAGGPDAGSDAAGASGSGGGGLGGGDAAAGSGGAAAGTTGSAGTTGDAGTTGAAGSGGSGGTGGCSGVYPIKLSAGKHYVIDHCDQPFFVVGDTAWSLIVAVSTADADVYFADRQARGFNTVIASLIEHHYAANPPRNAAGDLPFTGTLPGGARDFTTPNEAYFAHADEVISAAAARGIQLLLDASYLGFQGGDEGWYTEMQANGTTRLTTYGTYVGNRYKNFSNIIWVGGADYDPPDASGVDAVQTAILAADPNHVHTAHTNSGSNPKDIYGWTSWEKINNVYGYPAIGQSIYAISQQQYTRSDWQPFFLVESTYEHNPWTNPPPTALLIRQQAYEGVLNGGFGQLFGNEWVWPMGVVGLDGIAHSWQANLDSQGARDISRLASLFAGKHWEQLVPDTGHTFLTAGFSSGAAFASSSVTADGKLGMLYTPAVRNLTVNMTKMSGSTTARWYDPTSGSYTTVSGSPFANSGSHVFNPGGNNSGGDTDWVLLLEAP